MSVRAVELAGDWCNWKNYVNQKNELKQKEEKNYAKSIFTKLGVHS